MKAVLSLTLFIFATTAQAQIPTIGGIGPGAGSYQRGPSPIFTSPPPARINGIGTATPNIGTSSYPIPPIGGIGIENQNVGRGNSRIGGIGVDPFNQPGYDREGSVYPSRANTGGFLYNPERPSAPYNPGSINRSTIRAKREAIASQRPQGRAKKRIERSHRSTRHHIDNVPLRGPGGILQNQWTLDETGGADIRDVARLVFLNAELAFAESDDRILILNSLAHVVSAADRFVELRDGESYGALTSAIDNADELATSLSTHRHLAEQTAQLKWLLRSN